MPYPTFTEMMKLIKSNSKSRYDVGFEYAVHFLAFAIVYIGSLVIIVIITPPSALNLFNKFYFSSLVGLLGTIGVAEDFFKGLLVFVSLTLAFFSAILLFILLQITCSLKKAAAKDFLVKRGFKWDPRKGLQGWDFQGNVVVGKVDKNEDAVHIIQSELGCIVRDRNWKNPDMSFKFKIPKIPMFVHKDEENNPLRRGFGVIYRAKELGQYYMLKIDTSGYSPHVRNIFWENNGPIAKTSLTVKDLDQWIQAKLSIRDNFLSAEIGGDNFGFLIPTHSTVQRETEYPKKHKEKLESRPYSRIPFRDQGSVGFRSAPFEEVYIKDLEIREEPTLKYIARKLKSFYREYVCLSCFFANRKSQGVNR